MSEMSNLNMNLSAVRPPIAFAAKNARFVSNFPQGPDELWMADLKACRHDVQCEVFEDILFVESNGTAFIYGIEFEDGYLKGLKPDLALKQQSFIQFLRDDTRRDNDALGLAALIFTGHEYSTEGKATAAYIAARDTSLVMGVGYRNNDGEYELIGLDPEEDSWLESARSILPFDELGQPGWCQWDFILPAGHETLEPDEEDDERNAWYRYDEPTIVHYVTDLLPAVAARIKAFSRHYRVDFSKTTQSSYWMNHCEHCGMKQGDFEMYCEPQGAFFPVDERAASLIVLHEFVEPFGCNGSTAYGDHLFEYMRRA